MPQRSKFCKGVCSVTRKELNQHWLAQRAEIGQARLRAEAKVVDPQLFLSDPQLLKQVKIWIDIAGIDYARKTLSETGVAGPPNIDSIIRAALKV
jgi:hypothetical protein